MSVLGEAGGDMTPRGAEGIPLASPSARMSQCDRVLAVLQDGDPHSMQEIHRRAGFMRLNSRVSELRSRGCRIECDKTGGNYIYRLLEEMA